MALMYDRIMANGLVPCGRKEINEVVSEGLAICECFNIDSAAEIFFAKHGAGIRGFKEDNLSLKDFPNVAPVFPCMWMEFNPRIPQDYLGETSDGYVRGQLGCLIQSMWVDDHWECYATTIQQGQHGSFLIHGIHIFDVDSQGVCEDIGIGCPPMIKEWLDRYYPSDNPDQLQEKYLLVASLEVIMFPCLFALSLLHCKNVATTDNAPNSWQQMKHARRGGKAPLVTYKTLDVGPMRQLLRNEGQSETNGLKKALHICRGHFANYDEKPLFGKYTGQFWVPAHVRGSLSEGTVMKDYRVHA